MGDGPFLDRRLNLYQPDSTFEVDRSYCRHGTDGHVKAAGFFGRNITTSDGNKFNYGSLVDFLNTAMENHIIDDSEIDDPEKKQLTKKFSKANAAKVQALYQQFMDKRPDLISSRENLYTQAKDVQGAKKEDLLEKAAKRGHPEAQYELAEMLIHNPKRRKEAIKWYQAAANQNHLRAVAVCVRFFYSYGDMHFYETFVLDKTKPKEKEKRALFDQVSLVKASTRRDFRDKKYSNVPDLLALYSSYELAARKSYIPTNAYGGDPSTFQGQALEVGAEFFKDLAKQCVIDQLEEQRPKLDAHIKKVRNAKIQEKTNEKADREKLLIDAEQTRADLLQNAPKPNQYFPELVHKCNQDIESLKAQIALLGKEIEDLPQAPPSKQELRSFLDTTLVGISTHPEQVASKRGRNLKPGAQRSEKKMPPLREQILDLMCEFWKEALNAKKP